MSNIKDAAVSPEVTSEVKPRDVVLVQHLQRWAESRGLRSARGGHRRQGVILDDGSRIRQKAYRKTEMSIETLAQNHQSILEHIRCGKLAVFTSDEKELTYDEVVALLTGRGVPVQEESLREQLINMSAPVSPPELDSDGEPKIPNVVLPREDTTIPNIDLSATIAAVDMAEHRKKLPEDQSGATHGKKHLKKGKRE